MNQPPSDDPLRRLVGRPTQPKKKGRAKIDDLVPGRPKALDKPRRVSESMLWKINEDFYRSLGVEAWDNRTPSFVTNSAFMAEAYADLITSALIDMAPFIDRRQPIMILDLASGIGRLGFYLLRELNRKFRYFPQTRGLPFRLVLSDFTETTAEFWEHHPHLTQYFQSGQLDTAVFRPETDTLLTLRASGEELAPGQLVNPMFVTANYFFDSIRHDQFRVEDGDLHECMVTLRQKPKPEHSSEERVDIRDVIVDKAYVPVKNEPYYEDPEWNQLLDFYHQNVVKGDIMIPVGGLATLANLRALSNDNLVMLASDKGYTFWEDMACFLDHPLSHHDGSFSHAVNFHGLAAPFVNRGGHYFRTTHKELNSVHTACMMTTRFPFEPNHLAYAFLERVDRSNLINTISEQHQLYRTRAMQMNPPLYSQLCFIKMNLYDPKALDSCGKMLLQELPNLRFSLRPDVMRMVDEVWNNYFPFKGASNAPFWLGQICYHLGVYDRAAFFFDRAIEHFGEDDILWFLKGSCLEASGDKDGAHECYQRCLKLNPKMAEAREGLKSTAPTKA